MKSVLQIFIIFLIIFIIGAVYYKYFDTNKNIVEEINSLETDNRLQIEMLEKKISELEAKNADMVKKINNSEETQKEKNTKELIDLVNKNDETNTKEKLNKDINNINVKSKTNAKINNSKDITGKNKKPLDEIKNLVKDVEYNSIDDKGNNFYLLANSGKSNANNKDVLDLVNVRGEITSDKRDTIYIVSDFAEFNSTNSNSKFYDNVIINYQEKQITCVNFDINMETNKAIAYNNVIITDPKSTMKAGIVEFDLKTKNIDINPESTTKDIEVISN